MRAIAPVAILMRAAHRMHNAASIGATLRDLRGVVFCCRSVLVLWGIPVAPMLHSAGEPVWVVGPKCLEVPSLLRCRCEHMAVELLFE